MIWNEKHKKNEIKQNKVLIWIHSLNIYVGLAWEHRWIIYMPRIMPLFCFMQLKKWLPKKNIKKFHSLCRHLQIDFTARERFINIWRGEKHFQTILNKPTRSASLLYVKCQREHSNSHQQWWHFAHAIEFQETNFRDIENILMTA